MKRLSFALGLLVALTGAQQPLVAKIVFKTPKLFETDPGKLCSYAYKGDLKRVKEAVAKGANVRAMGEWTQIVDFVPKKGYGTPLHAAASGARTKVARFLLANGAKVNAVDKKGRTPLHFAARSGKKGIIRLLLAAKADPYIFAHGDGYPFQIPAPIRIDLVKLLDP